MALQAISAPSKGAWQAGKQADSFREAASVATIGNVAQHALAFLILLIIIGIAALVGGEFLDALPDDGPFSEEIGDVESNVGTGLIVFGIVLIVIPVVAILGYLWMNLGGLAGMNGGRFR